MLTLTDMDSVSNAVTIEMTDSNETRLVIAKKSIAMGDGLW